MESSRFNSATTSSNLGQKVRSRNFFKFKEEIKFSEKKSTPEGKNEIYCKFYNRCKIKFINAGVKPDDARTPALASLDL